ncbi:MAG: sugar phosphate isomerase/epimerase [Pirellula sp.]|nr:sugar phosphate isomerase/epimerase [Pirellula sp.]
MSLYVGASHRNTVASLFFSRSTVGRFMHKSWNSRLSVLELSTLRWSFEDDVLRYHEHGYRAIGVWRPKLSDCGEAKGRELLSEMGMSVSSLHWAGGFTGHDGRTFRESLHDALDAVQLAADLNADCLTVLAGSRAGHTKSHARRIFATALRELAECAQAMGVQLAVEPMHSGCAHDFTFLTNIPDTLDILGGIGHSNIGIVFDCYHMAQDPHVLEWLPSAVPFIRLVQCGDAKAAPLGLQNRCLLGEGYVPIADIIRTIEHYGYEGYYEVELLGEDVEDYDYEHMLDASRSLLCELLQS